MRRWIPVITVALFLSSSIPAAALVDKEVIGTSSSISDAVFPPITAGPGHILPDSPFYFADKLYQEFRLVLVFTPENRAELHTQIAHERLAELRVEAARNDQQGVDRALMELEHEAMAGAQDVRDASSQGKDVTQLARDIHQALTDYRSAVEMVEAQVPDTAFAQKLAATSDVLRDARVISEDALPQSDIEHEIAANVDTEVDNAVLGLKTSVDSLQKKMSIQQMLASKAAEKAAQKEKSAAIKQTAKDSQAALRAARKKAIQEYLAKVDALRKQREAELATLKQTIKDLQSQLKQIDQQEKTDLKNVRTGTTPKVSITPKPTVTPQP
jgi:hypothetical protein